MANKEKGKRNDDLAAQYELYRSGNIDELLVILDEEQELEQKQAHVPRNAADQISQPRLPSRSPGDGRKGQLGPNPVRNTVGNPVRNTTRNTVRNEVRNEVRNAARNEVRNEVRNAPMGSIIPFQSRTRLPEPSTRASKASVVTTDPEGRRRKRTTASASRASTIDPDWMLQTPASNGVDRSLAADPQASGQRLPSGLSAADFAGPLNLPDTDFFNLNTRRQAAARTNKAGGSNQGSSFRSTRYTERAQKQPGSQRSNTPKQNQYQHLAANPIVPSRSQSHQSQSQSQSQTQPQSQTQSQTGRKGERVNVQEMLDSGTDVLDKVRTLLASNQTIPTNGLAGLETQARMEQERKDAVGPDGQPLPPPPPVSQEKIVELHAVQDHWIELDNEIKGIRSLIRELQKKKKELEEYLKSEMQKYQIPHLTPPNGGEKIVLKTGNRKGTYKKDYIFAKLQEKLGDPEMAAHLAEHLEQSRPVSETVTITRSKR